MSKIEVLKRLYDHVMDEVFQTSGNYLMSMPRKGYEREWTEHKETAEVLAELISEYEP